MPIRRYLDERKRDKRLLKYKALLLIWIALMTPVFITGWTENTTLDDIAGLTVIVGVILLIRYWRRRPTIFCPGCGAAGWADDLQEGGSTCPHCGSIHFLTWGTYRGSSSLYKGLVLGEDIVARRFFVDDGFYSD